MNGTPRGSPESGESGRPSIEQTDLDGQAEGPQSVPTYFQGCGFLLRQSMGNMLGEEATSKQQHHNIRSVMRM